MAGGALGWGVSLISVFAPVIPELGNLFRDKTYHEDHHGHRDQHGRRLAIAASQNKEPEQAVTDARKENG